MKRLAKIGNILMVVMLLAGGVTSFAAAKSSMNQAATRPHVMMGQIASIGDHSLTLKDKNWKLQTIQLTDHSMTNGLKSGDKVSVAVQDGHVSSIKKLAGTSSGY
jgi:ABC-type molybdate transport system ATPase subunit